MTWPSGSVGGEAGIAAIEQASRRWRGGRRDDQHERAVKFDFHTGGQQGRVRRAFSEAPDVAPALTGQEDAEELAQRLGPPRRSSSGGGGASPPPQRQHPADDGRWRVLPWFYRDPQGAVQGPFEATQMRQWFQAGYFDDDLPLRQGSNGDFISLKLLFANPPGDAFVTTPTDLWAPPPPAPPAPAPPPAAPGMFGRPGLVVDDQPAPPQNQGFNFMWGGGQPAQPQPPAPPQQLDYAMGGLGIGGLRTAPPARAGAQARPRRARRRRPRPRPAAGAAAGARAARLAAGRRQSPRQGPVHGRDQAQEAAAQQAQQRQQQQAQRQSQQQRQAPPASMAARLAAQQPPPPAARPRPAAPRRRRARRRRRRPARPRARPSSPSTTRRRRRPRRARRPSAGPWRRRTPRRSRPGPRRSSRRSRALMI